MTTATQPNVQIVINGGPKGAKVAAAQKALADLRAERDMLLEIIKAGSEASDADKTEACQRTLEISKDIEDATKALVDAESAPSGGRFQNSLFLTVGKKRKVGAKGGLLGIRMPVNLDVSRWANVYAYGHAIMSGIGSMVSHVGNVILMDPERDDDGQPKKFRKVLLDGVEIATIDRKEYSETEEDNIRLAEEKAAERHAWFTAVAEAMAAMPTVEELERRATEILAERQGFLP